MKILIIGGTGLLSGSVTAEALKRGMSVTMINRGHNTIPDGVALIKTDKNNKRYIQSQLDKQHFDAVIDFLCLSPDQSRDSFSLYSKYTDQYVFISSMAVYNKSTPGPLIEEHDKGNTGWIYGDNKWKSELEIQGLAKDSYCNLTIVRPGVTYGDNRIPYGISPYYGRHWTLAARAIAGKPIITWLGGNNPVRVLRVEDFAVGCVGLIGNRDAFGESFNIAGDEVCTYNDILNEMGINIGCSVKTVDIPPMWYARELEKKGEELLVGRVKTAECTQEEARAVNAKLKRFVPAFQQTIYIKEGIKKTIDRIREQNYQYGIDWKYDAESDRIIRKWCERNQIDVNQYNIGFKDYLKSASFYDRLEYWCIFNKDKAFVSVVFKLYILIKKVI